MYDYTRVRIIDRFTSVYLNYSHVIKFTNIYLPCLPLNILLIFFSNSLCLVNKFACSNPKDTLLK